MKMIAPVNTYIPGLKNYIDYNSGKSLLDYDIIVFDPSLPYYSRETFTAGGSCVDIDSGKILRSSIKHWKSEIHDALKDGKNVFFLLSDYKQDSVAVGYTHTKGNRNFTTTSLTNYDVLPISTDVRNGNGNRFRVTDAKFTELFNILQDQMTYRVVINSNLGEAIASNSSGSSVFSTTVKLGGYKGNLVLLPYFNLSDLVTDDSSGGNRWTEEALGLGNRLIASLVQLDRSLKKESSETPTPAWVDEEPVPKLIESIKLRIKTQEDEIQNLKEVQDLERERLGEETKLRSLLYETGLPLEESIGKALGMLGYDVSNYRSGDVEIDHVIISPSGFRMIGEAEGKDRSAIDITKFRQLESNIGEDFEREEVTQPAKGVLFGNGYRFTKPGLRDGQFTQKCFVNAERLGTALIQTSDLYEAVVYLQDNPKDESYRQACREAIENSTGALVVFPSPPAS